MKKVVIIGSGIGGLTAGNLLVKKGHKVTIFEAHSTTGGYTAGFYRKGCYFESGTVCFESIKTVTKAMRDIGVLDKIDFLKLGMRIVAEDFSGTPENYEDFKQIIYQAFPNEKEKLDNAFSDLDRILSALELTLDMPLPSVLSTTEMLKSMLPSLPSLPKIIKITNEFGDITSSEFAAQYFEKDSKLFDLFSRFSYPDMSTIFVATALSGVFRDIWTVKGGLQSWANILAQHFTGQGGDLQLKTHVDRIITKNKAVVGVTCQDIFYEADYVISAADYKRTFLKLLDDKSLIPVETWDNIENAAVSEGFFTVYLVLNMPGEQFTKHMQHSHVYSLDFKPGYDIYNPDDHEFFEKTAFYLYSPSMMDARLAPRGQSSLMIQCRVPHHWMENWGGGNKATYSELKERAMDILIDRASGMIPGLKDHIKFKDAATPLTYERYTENTDGASSAWSWNPKKAFFKNAIGTYVKTPVKNLYIGSSWAMQVGGVPGAISAAYECVKNIR